MLGNAYRPVTYKIGNQNMSSYPMGMGMGTPMPMQQLGGLPMGMPTGTATGTGTVPPQATSGNQITQTGTVIPSAQPVFEQSYIENILRLNLGKVGTFYMTYENNSEWNAKIFKGVLEAAGRDHIIISDPQTGVRTILLMVNLDYATFDEPLIYQYPGVIGNPGTPSRGRF